MLGVELLDSGAIAALVGPDGRLAARAEAIVAPPATLDDAVIRALADMPATAGGPVAVTTWNPDASGHARVLDAVRTRLPGASLVSPPIASGLAAAAAEAWVGSARGAGDVVFFAVANHAVAGILRDGRPVPGARRRAAAVGWLALNPVEREDYRKAGCLETEVAEAGIVRRFVWRMKAGDYSRVPDAVDGELADITLAHIFAAARQGDGVAISVVRDTAKYLGMAAANLVAVADPEVLVLGGIMASEPDLLLEPVRFELTRRLAGATMTALRVVTASLGADAPVIGAVRLAAAAL